MPLKLLPISADSLRSRYALSAARNPPSVTVAGPTSVVASAIAAGAIAAIDASASTLAPKRRTSLRFMIASCYPSGHQRPVTRVVFIAQDSFATAQNYKWILMQHLIGFYAARAL